MLKVDGHTRSVSLPTEITLAGILKLSVKYDIPHFRPYAISHLTEYYPTTLAAWDKRPPRATAFSPFDALDLARSMNVPQILPAIFLDCVSQPIDALSQCIAEGLKSGTMTANDVRTFLSARQALLDATFKHVYKFLFVSKPMYCKANYCSSERLDWFHRNKGYVQSGWTPLAIEINWNTLGVCVTCLSTSKDLYKTGREKVWTELPSYFNLPPWEQLV